MEIRSILVNVGLGPNHAAIDYAVRLAEAHGADLLGMAAAQPSMALAGMDNAQVAVDYYAVQRENIQGLLAQAEERFRSLVPANIPTEWRSYVANTTDTVVDLARRCDLVVAATGDAAEGVEGLDAGHLILAGGRPVVLAGDGSLTAKRGRAVIAWKDTREARRAVSDALPLLQRSTHVGVVTLSEGDVAWEAASLTDLVEWLGRHDVLAEHRLVDRGADFLDALGLLTHVDAPDLVVAGGYGHSRFREWLLGGVTDDLLSANGVNRLFSN